MTSRKIATILVAPTVLLLGLIVIFPMLFSISVALTGYDLRIPEHFFVGFGNFINVFKQVEFYNAITITGTMIITEVIIELIIGFALALLLLQFPRTKQLFQPILLVPTMITPVVIGYIGRLIFEGRSGPINYFLNILGGESLPWHASPKYALITVLILRIWQWSPFVMAVILSGIISLPVEPYDAAKVDGANSLQIFIYLTLPLLKPIIMLVVIMRALETLQTFDIIYVLTMGGPGSKTTTFSLFTYLLGFRYWDIGGASAAAWIVMVPLSFLITKFVKLMGEGEDLGKKKEIKL